MAKKPLSSFSKLSDRLDKIAPDGALIDDSPFAKIDEWISSGSYILNAALSGSLYGGLPNRRSLLLYGVEGTAKTYLALSFCRNAQSMGYDIIYCDSEGSIDKDFVTRLGADTSNIRLQPVNTIEEFNHLAAQITNSYKEMIEAKEEPPKVLVVLDSLGNLSSEKEVTDSKDGSDKRDMTKQQAIRKMFRVNGLQFAKYGIPFIIVGHSYACLSEESKVQMADNSLKSISEIIEGDNVLTLAGPKEVLDKFEYDFSNYIELIFEDNYVIKCTDLHKFAIEKNGKLQWIMAKDLKEDDEILIL